MVLNQGQVLVVVSDWEPYLGSLLLYCGSWAIVYVKLPVSALVSHSVTFVLLNCFSCSSFNKRRMYSNHAALWSPLYDNRDNAIPFTSLQPLLWAVLPSAASTDLNGALAKIHMVGVRLEFFSPLCNRLGISHPLGLGVYYCRDSFTFSIISSVSTDKAVIYSYELT